MISEKARLVGNRIKMMRLAKGLRQKNDFFVYMEKSADKSSKRGYTVEDLLNIVAKIKG